MEETALSMERAAKISGDPDLYFRAAYFWLEAERPEKALVLLEKLAERKRPQLQWLLALANTYMMLDKSRSAAITMDRVVRMDPKSEYLYNAGVLWLQAGRPGKALGHLQPLCKRQPAKADWFVALAHAWLGRNEICNAAGAMERAADIGGRPADAFQAGLLWLRAGRADDAVRVLVPLSRQAHPRAEWLVALSNAWGMKEAWAKAAGAMEQAAGISRKHDHAFSAAGLWLQAERPRKALPLLTDLAGRPDPQAKWLALLSDTWVLLEDIPRAAGAMERAAEITRKGKDYYRAGMLWLQAGDNTRGISLLTKSAATTPVEQEWLVSLAQALADDGQVSKAAAFMERTVLTAPGTASGIRYQGAALWLHLQRPEKALPILTLLCSSPRPEINWLMSLVRTSVELERQDEAEKALARLIDFYPQDPEAWRLAAWLGIQQADYEKAAAAMAVAVRLGPPDPVQVKALADLYQMAGVPVKAATALRKTWETEPSAAGWDRLVDIYLSGHRYRMALEAATSAVKAEATAKRWESVGSIAFRLRRFEQSYEAYRRSVALKPEAGVSLKAGYAALKLDKLNEAAGLFMEVMRLAGKNSPISYEAHRNLVYIKEMKAFLEKRGSPGAGG